eukprot:TRINITY_DN107_c4_g1_i1.p1 TRINITY_DN107_c4_g1~~TRINITY_DN107_c4_g1_i1.p1  ORF type:complete len:313 (+),score=22.49 TRINITY_DN107_c4_g1_i1:595-1533(+)
MEMGRSGNTAKASLKEGETFCCNLHQRWGRRPYSPSVPAPPHPLPLTSLTLLLLPLFHVHTLPFCCLFFIFYHQFPPRVYGFTRDRETDIHSNMAKPTPFAIDQSDFPYRADGKGILHYLGCLCKEAGFEGPRGEESDDPDWVNPFDCGLINIVCSSLAQGNKRNVADYSVATLTKPDVVCVTENIPKSWIEVQLPVGVHIWGYQFSSSYYEKYTSLRNWSVLGTFMDGPNANWFPIATHNSDQSLLVDSKTRTFRAGWKTNIKQRQAFHRIRIVGGVSSGNCNTSPTAPYVLSLSRLELFGKIVPRVVHDQ